MHPYHPSVLPCALLALSVLQLRAAPTIAYDFGDPDPAEVRMLFFINRARADPEAEGLRLANTSDEEVRDAYDFFNVDLGKLQADFATYPARPPLAWNAALMTSSLTHSNYMISIDSQTHDRPAGQTFGSSFSDAGYAGYGRVSENIYAFSESPWYAHAGFNVDWGTPDNDGDGMQDALGHRHSIMENDQTGALYREAGMAAVPDSSPGTRVGPLVVTQHFGFRPGTSFLVGTLYNDGNDNGEYDPGEGLAGVTVMPDQGDFYAVSNAAGAYSIPLGQRTGSLGVSFSGPGLEPPLARVLVLSGANRLLDIVDGAFVDGGPFGGYWGFDRAIGAWGRSPWFGWLVDDPSGWIFHERHHWIYPVRGGNSDSLWAWDPYLGWFWTGASTHPWIYHVNSGRWLFHLDPSEAPQRSFYVDGNGGGWIVEPAPIPPAAE